MKQSVKLFALLQDLAGAEEVALELGASPTVGDVRRTLAEQLPKLRPLLANCTIAVNNQYAADAAIIPNNAEIACLPPVSGG